MTIARNLHRDHYRALGPPLVPIDEEMVDGAPSVEARLESADDLRSVRARLRKVARGDRRALLLYVVRELSYADVAHVLGIT